METAERLGLPAPLVSCSERIPASPASTASSRAPEVARAVELLGDDQRQLLALQRKARARGLESGVVRRQYLVPGRRCREGRIMPLVHFHLAPEMLRTSSLQEWMLSKERPRLSQCGLTSGAEMGQLSGCSIHSNQRSGNEGVRIREKTGFSRT